ncbi:unnamed protein product [Sympodiomycopsis kandeliae]
MTRAEAAPNSVAEAARDKHSRSQPAGSSGPAKDNISHPGGASVLGTEIGAETDMLKERQDAIAQGEQLPPSSTSRGTAGQLGFGMQSGADQGFQDRSAGQRDDLQSERNQEFSSGQPDLRNIARTSGGSAATNPTGSDFSSTGNANPSELLGRVGQSAGQPSGTGAYDGEIARDADTRES